MQGSGVSQSLDVAIVGGGIIGVMVAIGLRRRGINAVIYERAPTWNEKTDANTSNAYWNGYHLRTREDAEDESKSLLFRTLTNNLSFWGCICSQFLQGMADLLPEEVAKFGKQLASYQDD
ncbi:monooxygenase FAD-binding protein [Fusarium phyllophilum]|uniref:Monooxygenase FAD-binding protein n=1 Tax=Fusarium phyllophilum TaxID=47803 RepID=A0A8H5K6E4_9HYPO|nr:monooxygenase FAD-binding protein [Fusarium phyllophilum]